MGVASPILVAMVMVFYIMKSRDRRVHNPILLQIRATIQELLP